MTDGEFMKACIYPVSGRGRPADRQSILSLSSEPRPALRCFAVLSVLLWLPTWCFADTVTLVSGTVLEGQVTKQSKAGIVLEHEDLGKVEIRSSRIKSIVFDRADAEIVLVGGNTITGKIIDQNETEIRLQNEDLGQVDVPRSRIRSVQVNSPDADVVLIARDSIKGTMVERNEAGIVLEHENLGRLEIPKEQIKSVVLEKDERAWFDPKWLNALSAKIKEKGWEASVDLSLNTASGNIKNEQSTRLGVDAAHTTEKTRFTHDLSYYNKTSRGDTTDNKLSYRVMHDWLNQESPWFCFVAGQYDYDEFMSWRKRVSAYTGPGYRFVDTDSMTFDVRAGLGTRKEWGSENDDYKLEAAEGLHFSWDMTSRQKVTASTVVAGVVGDLDDYRGRSAAEWQFSFDRDMALRFILGIEHEYTSVVDPGDRHSDTRVYLGLRYGI